MNFERVRKRYLVGIPAAFILAGIFACPWLAERQRTTQHTLLVNQMSNNGCVAQKVLQISVNPMGEEKISSSISQVPQISQSTGGHIVSGTQTFFQCPAAMSPSGKTRWTVVSECHAMLNPVDIIKQFFLSPLEPWRIASCSVDSIND